MNKSVIDIGRTIIRPVSIGLILIALIPVGLEAKDIFIDIATDAEVEIVALVLDEECTGDYSISKSGHRNVDHGIRYLLRGKRLTTASSRSCFIRSGRNVVLVNICGNETSASGSRKDRLPATRCLSDDSERWHGRHLGRYSVAANCCLKGLVTVVRNVISRITDTLTE